MLIIFHGYINVVAMGHQHFITRNPNFFDKKFWSKKPPIWFFCPHVQLDQSAILDKLIWIWSFWLGFLLNHHDNNIIWASIQKIYYLSYFIEN